MSHDQAPGRMRVVTSGAGIPKPAPASATIEPVNVEAPARGISLLMMLIFLLACALGGIAVAIVGRG